MSKQSEGMKRMLQYPSSIKSDPNMSAACKMCENYCGKDHDYSECTKCPVFKMFCELQQYKYIESFQRSPECMGGCW